MDNYQDIEITIKFRVHEKDLTEKGIKRYTKFAQKVVSQKASNSIRTKLDQLLSLKGDM